MSVLIHQGSWRKISAEACDGGDILIERVGGGLGILVYDPASQDTFCGHFPAPDAQHVAGLHGLLDQAESDFRQCALVRIFVSGCTEQDHESWEDTGPLAQRFVDAALRKRQQSNQRRDVRWPRRKALHVQMSLYPGSGEYDCSFHW